MWVTRHDNTVLVNLELTYPEGAYRTLLREAESWMVEMRGTSEMVANRSRVHELAGVVQAYVEQKKHFPRGTVGQTGNRGNSLPPTLRASWLAELIPFLRGDYRELQREDDKSWQEGENMFTAQILVPTFLSRMPPWFVRYPGVGPALAATHFVGVAGVGLDAAMYHAAEAGAARELGIFGYDRETKPEDIKDGLEQTIVALQVPSTSAMPWIAGGGGTLRGISRESDALEPFVCLEYEGKTGTFAIMADGQVRFVPATLDPKLFRALCTIAGDDKVSRSELDRNCPVVPPPEGEAELKTKGGRQLPTREKDKPKEKSPTDKPPVAATEPAAPAGWVWYRNPTGHYRILVPVGPNVEVTNASAFGEIGGEISTAVRTNRQRVYEVRWGTIPSDLAKQGAAAVSARLRLVMAASAMGNPSGNTATDRVITWNEWPGREITFLKPYEGGNPLWHSRILIINNNYCVISYLVFGGAADPADQKIFRDSFQVLSPN
jgi:hypothetical protein